MPRKIFTHRNAKTRKKQTTTVYSTAEVLKLLKLRDNKIDALAKRLAKLEGKK